MTKRVFLLICVICGLVSSTHAQGSAADYERANGLKSKYESAAINIAGNASWIGNTHKLWYRKLSRGLKGYLIFDAHRFNRFAKALMAVPKKELDKELANINASTINLGKSDRRRLCP